MHGDTTQRLRVLADAPKNVRQKPTTPSRRAGAVWLVCRRREGSARLVSLKQGSKIFWMLAKKTSKNQITLPKKVADQFPGADYFDVRVADGTIVLRPVRPFEADQVRAKLAALGIDDADIQAAVRWARSTSR
jgi:hypothetical protein